MSLEAIGIVSEDVKKSIDFYRRLGIKLKKMSAQEHYDGVTPSGTRIMVDSAELIRSIDPAFKKIRGNGIALCFNQGSARKVDKLYAELTGAGFKGIKAPWDAFWGQRYACVSDPDGNQIDLFAAL
jgi:uncharacterized glyoxalase superfamily protein PhnB